MKLPQEIEKYIMLYLYDELSETEKQELEAHLQFNQASQKRLEEMRSFHSTMNERELPEPGEAALAAARARLRARLQQERSAVAQAGRIRNFLEALTPPGSGLSFSLAAAVLVLGFLLGRFSGPGSGTDLAVRQGLVPGDEMPFISNVDLVEYEPRSGRVKVHYKVTQDVALQGDIGDEAIRQVLTHTIRTESHPGRRLTAVKAAAGSKASAELEDALIHAMERDEVAGVRLRAAKVLKNMPSNRRIRMAFIRVLLKDENPAMRIAALAALSQSQGSDVLPIFQNASRGDENEFVRLKASQALERTENPEFREPGAH